MLHIFRTPFFKNTSGRLHLNLVHGNAKNTPSLEIFKNEIRKGIGGICPYRKHKTWRGKTFNLNDFFKGIWHYSLNFLFHDIIICKIVQLCNTCPTLQYILSRFLITAPLSSNNCLILQYLPFFVKLTVSLCNTKHLPHFLITLVLLCNTSMLHYFAIKCIKLTSILGKPPLGWSVIFLYKGKILENIIIFWRYFCFAKHPLK